MRRHFISEFLDKIFTDETMDEPEIEIKKDEFTVWDYLHRFFW